MPFKDLQALRTPHEKSTVCQITVQNICQEYKTGDKIFSLELSPTCREKKHFEMKENFLFALLFCSISSFNFPILIQQNFSVDIFTKLQLPGAQLRPPPGAKGAHYPSLLLFYVAIFEPCPWNYRAWQRNRTTF